jgi:hypothetical protein
MRSLLVSFALILASYVNAGESDNRTIYRAVISFYSICCGPDPKDEESVSEYIEDFEQNHKVKLKVHYPSHRQGPEGEWAMCFKLEEVNEAGQVEFIRGIRETLKQLRTGKDPNRDGGAEIQESAPCI